MSESVTACCGLVEVPEEELVVAGQGGASFAGSLDLERPLLHRLGVAVAEIDVGHLVVAILHLPLIWKGDVRLRNQPEVDAIAHQDRFRRRRDVAQRLGCTVEDEVVAVGDVLAVPGAVPHQVGWR